MPILCFHLRETCRTKRSLSASRTELGMGPLGTRTHVFFTALIFFLCGMRPLWIRVEESDWGIRGIECLFRKILCLSVFRSEPEQFISLLTSGIHLSQNRHLGIDIIIYHHSTLALLTPQGSAHILNQLPLKRQGKNEKLK